MELQPLCYCTMENYNNTSTFGISEVPLFVVYLKLFIILLVTLAVGVPCGLVIRVIVKETELHTKYYFVLVLLLECDMLYIFGDAVTTFIALLCLAGVDITISDIYLSTSVSCSVDVYSNGNGSLHSHSISLPAQEDHEQEIYQWPHHCSMCTISRYIFNYHINQFFPICATEGAVYCSFPLTYLHYQLICLGFF